MSEHDGLNFQALGPIPGGEQTKGVINAMHILPTTRKNNPANFLPPLTTAEQAQQAQQQRTSGGAL